MTLGMTINADDYNTLADIALNYPTGYDFADPHDERMSRLLDRLLKDRGYRREDAGEMLDMILEDNHIHHEDEPETFDLDWEPTDRNPVLMTGVTLAYDDDHMIQRIQCESVDGCECITDRDPADPDDARLTV